MKKQESRRKFIKDISLVISAGALTSFLPIFSSCSKSEEFKFYKDYFIKPDFCIGCGDCLEACYYEAIILPKLTTYDINDDTCIECGRCEKVCDGNAISIAVTDYNFVSSACVGCGNCITACKENGDCITYSEPNYKVENNCDTAQCNQECIMECPENAITIVNEKAVIDTEKCTLCALCLTCPLDAISSAKVSKDDENCIHCGECFAVCAYEAIEKKPPENYHTPILDQEKCVLCGNCFDVCQDDSIIRDLQRAMIENSNCTKCGKCVPYCDQKAIIQR